MPESNALVEKRQQFAAKQKELGEVFALAGADFDFNNPKVLEKLGVANSTEGVAKVKERNRELDDLGAELRQAELKEVRSAIAEREKERSEPTRSAAVVHPGTDADGRLKSFGELAIESKAFEDGMKSHAGQGFKVEVDIDIKTLFQTTAGYAPQSVRTGLLVPGVTRPVQILDLIPTRPMNQASDVYMLETTRTHASAEKAEGIAYAESTFVWTQQTNPVQKITDSIPVTDEQLEDAPEVGAILDQRLRFGLRQRLDLQVFNGNGTPPNLKGMLNVAGISTQAKGTDPVFDAVFKAMILVRITGRADPSAIIMHPTDWQGVRLARTADGLYIMGNPADPGSTTLFGLPVALCDAGSAGTALVGDFINFTYIGERRGVEVQIGYINVQFTTGMKTIRADLRCVFTVTRPAALCTVTGL